jgi:hypothetical protein
VIALLYISMNFLLSVLAGRLENWMRRRRGINELLNCRQFVGT